MQAWCLLVDGHIPPEVHEVDTARSCQRETHAACLGAHQQHQRLGKRLVEVLLCGKLGTKLAKLVVN